MSENIHISPIKFPILVKKQLKQAFLIQNRWQKIHGGQLVIVAHAVQTWLVRKQTGSTHLSEHPSERSVISDPLPLD